MEEQLKEMLGKRPDELEGETLKLFNAIMKIADERDKLREENKALKTRKIIGRIDEINIEDLEDILSPYYIPKSKVKEKIEELDKEEQELQNSISDEEREEYSDASISWELCDIETRRRCYKELLEE